MQRIVNIHQAKTNFSKLVSYAMDGQEIIIAKAGIPVARLVPMPTEKPKRKPGFLKGKLKIAEDFDAPLPSEIIDSFEGES